jgi:hypothetical protein
MFRTCPDRAWGHPVSCVYSSLYRGVKWPTSGVDYPFAFTAEVIKKGRAIPLLPLWAFMACTRVNFIYTFNWPTAGCCAIKKMNVHDINDDWLRAESLRHEFSSSELKLGNLKSLKLKIVRCRSKFSRTDPSKWQTITFYD